MGYVKRKAWGLVVAIAACALAGCGENQPPPKTPQETVPANSASEGQPAGAASNAASTKKDPSDSDGDSEPSGVMSTAGATGGTGASGGANGASGGATSANGTGGGGNMPEKLAAPTAPTINASKSAKGPKATRAECGKALDRYIDLAVSSDARLAGVSKDMIKQAFAQTAGNPCDSDGITRGQYKCTMKATTTDEWQTCVK